MSNLKTTFQYLDKEGNNTIRKSALKDALMLTSENYDRHIIFQQIEQCGDEINYQKFMDIFRCAYKGDFANQWLFGLYDKGTHDASKIERDLLRLRTCGG